MTGSIDESELMEVPVAQSLVGGDPQLREIKKRLIAKKEILKQIKTMYTSFMGGTGACECCLVRVGGGGACECCLVCGGGGGGGGV